MSLAPLLIVGAGGFGREVINIVAAINELDPTWRLIGVADDEPSEASLRSLARSGTLHLGSVESATTDSGHSDLALVVAIGDPQTRRRVVDTIGGRGTFPALVHPGATIGPNVRLSGGCLVAPGCRLSADIHLGDHVHIDQNVTVGHDTVIDAYTRLNPQSCVSGEVTLGHGVFFGANATILPRLRVGDHAVIGAGAVVVRNVTANTTVKGVPAR